MRALSAEANDLVRDKKLVDPVTIRINRGTLQRLKDQGKYNEILDDILKRLLDERVKKK